MGIPYHTECSFFISQRMEDFIVKSRRKDFHQVKCFQECQSRELLHLTTLVSTSWTKYFILNPRKILRLNQRCRSPIFDLAIFQNSQRERTEISSDRELTMFPAQKAIRFFLTKYFHKLCCFESDSKSDCFPEVWPSIFSTIYEKPLTQDFFRENVAKKWIYSMSFHCHNRNTPSKPSGCFDGFFFVEKTSKAESSKKRKQGKSKSMWGTWRSWLRCKVLPSNPFWSINISHDVVAILLLIHHITSPE